MQLSHDPVPQRGAVRAIAAAVVIGGAFELATATATQIRAVRVHSPWQDDPYNVMVSFAQFTAPVLVAVIGLRLLAWRQPGGLDRERQLLRASAVLVAVMAATISFEWVALAFGAHRSDWTAITAGLIAGLVVLTVGVGGLAAVLVRYGAVRRLGRPWRDDWLADAVWVCGHIPWLRRLATPATAAVVRRQAVTTFAIVSVVSAVAVIGALAYGERWTDPALISWALGVEATSTFAFCMISNPVAGFVARPAPARPRVELAVTAACVAVQLAVAFRGPVWRAATGHDPDNPSELTLLVLLAAVGVGVATYVVATVAGAGRRQGGPGTPANLEGSA
jgi:hypothetical protein